MRIFKEVLVLAVIVLVFAYAARQLEGVDAGELDSGVPPLMQSLKQFLGIEEAGSGTPSESSAPAP